MYDEGWLHQPTKNAEVRQLSASEALAESAQILAVAFSDYHDAVRSELGLQPPEALDALVSELDGRPSLDERALRRLTNVRRRLADALERCVWDIDARAVAIHRFFNGALRKGLGIYPTPDAVARLAVWAIRPPSGSVVCDPACGTGTFLLETARFWKATSVSGTLLANDISARLLSLTRITTQAIHPGLLLTSQADFQDPRLRLAAAPDVILTNPPFGTAVSPNRDYYAELRPEFRHNSELLFLQRSIEVLKPGGMLGIVLPRSVLNSRRNEHALEALGREAYLVAIADLPGAAFAVSGAQTQTSLLFVRKYRSTKESTKRVAPLHVNVVSLGFDGTGRVTNDSDVHTHVTQLSESIHNGSGGTSAKISAYESFRELSALLRPVPQRGETTFGELCDLIVTGVTPPKAMYSERGLFVMKVGNLTGRGIEWTARERNYVDLKSSKRSFIQLQPNDIVLTSSAHSPVYIGRKSDIVVDIPDSVGGKATFVGEVMLLRPKRTVSPYGVLLAVRDPENVEALQRLARGQTAHLYADDVKRMPVSRRYLDSALPEVRAAHQALEDEAHEALRQFTIRSNRQRTIDRAIMKVRGHTIQGT